MLTSAPASAPYDSNLADARIAFRSNFDSDTEAATFEAGVLAVGRAALPPCAVAVLDGVAPAAAFYDFLPEQLDAADPLIIRGMTKAEARAVVLVRLAGPDASTPFEAQARYLAALPEFVVSVRGGARALAPAGSSGPTATPIHGAALRLERVGVEVVGEAVAVTVPVGRRERAEVVMGAVRNGQISPLEALALFSAGGPLVDDADVIDVVAVEIA
jgi:hypothetical protein